MGVADRLDAFRSRYRHAEHILAALAFAGGFGWDLVTLGRVDGWLDQAFLAIYLVGLVLFTVLEQRTQRDPNAWPRLGERAVWLTYALQFFTGGLFSAHVVFYARSAATPASWFFVLLLVALMVANELAQSRLSRHQLRLAFLWLLSFAYGRSVFPSLVPSQDALALFVGMGFATAITVVAILAIAGSAGAMGNVKTWGLCGVMIVSTGALDTAGCIPPLPWAIIAAGAFHDVQLVDADPSPDGRSREYVLTYEKQPWYQPWRRSDVVFRGVSGSPVFAFTAIFAPTGTTRKVFHRWQRYDEPQRAWLDTDRIDVTSSAKLVGGADMGFRTYSRKQNTRPGAWRVIVELADGRAIGQFGFDVVAEAPGPMTTRVAR